MVYYDVYFRLEFLHSAPGWHLMLGAVYANSSAININPKGREADCRDVG